MSAWLRYSLFWSKSFQLLNTQKNYIDYTYGLSVRNYPCEDTYAFCLDIKSLITAVNSHTLRRLNQYHHLMIIISSIIIIIINYYYYYYHVILCNFRSLHRKAKETSPLNTIVKSNFPLGRQRSIYAEGSTELRHV